MGPAGAVASLFPPRYFFQVAWGYDPELPGLQYTDETQYLDTTDEEWAALIERGRDHPLEQFKPGTLTCFLHDKNRRFDPLNTASPLYPNVRPDTRCRFMLEWPGLGRLSAAGIAETFEPDGAPSGVTGWAIDTGNGTVVASTAKFYRGTASMLVTKGSGAGDVSARSGPVAVTAGDPVTAVARVRQGSGAARNASVRIAWFNNTAGSGSPASTSVGADVDNVEDASVWSRAKCEVAAAPAGAQSYRVILYVKAAAANEGHHFDFVGADHVATVINADRFTGYLEEPEVVFRDRRRTVKITASDWLRVGAETPTAPSWWADIIASLNPDHWWRLGAPTVESASGPRYEDSGSIPVSLGRPIWTAGASIPQAGQTLVPDDANPSVTFGGLDEISAGASSAAKITALPFTVIMVVKSTWKEEAGGEADSAVHGPAPLWWQHTNTKLYYQQGTAGPYGGVGFRVGGVEIDNVASERWVHDGQPHVIFALASATDMNLHIDGVLVASGVVPGAPTTAVANSPTIGGKQNDAAHVGFRGNIDEVAIWRSVLAPATLDQIMDIGWHGRSGETAGTQFSEVLAQATNPPGSVVDAGTTVLGPTLLYGRSILEVWGGIARAEDGAIYITRQGDVRLRARASLEAAPYTVVQATFGPGATEIPFADPVFASPFSTIVNIATVTRRGGSPKTARDTASIGLHHEKAITWDDLPLLDDAAAATLAQRIVDRFKNPLPRVASITTDLRAHHSIPAAVGARELEDRVRVKTTPETGSALDQQANIQGFSERYGRGKAEMTLHLFPVLA